MNKYNEQSQTNEIGIYNIKTPDGTILKIIDTPFSGNRVDIKHDLLNIGMIKQVTNTYIILNISTIL